ncbi:MAG TPA: YceI family protein [Gemmatimonadaceae bacterium]|nr:YceI family protein [Gemmatimonadaceae bacterium]
MRTHLVTSALATLASAILATVVVAQGGPSLPVHVEPQSKLWLEGNSTMHEFTCRTNDIQATVEIDPGYRYAAAATRAHPFNSVDVQIPVRSLKCGKDKMDENMYKTLRADEFTDIHYTLRSYTVEEGTAEGDSMVVVAVGTLTIAGQEREVTMKVSTDTEPNGAVRAHGALTLLMTDFGIKPPKFMLGTLKVDNKIRIGFDLHVTSTGAVAEALGLR